LSLAVGIAGAGTLSHSTVASAGTPKSSGAVVSTTVIVWSPDVWFPHASVAVQVLTIVHSSAHPPATTASLSAIATLPQVSEPLAIPSAPELWSPLHSTVASAGTLRLGAVVSTTVITWSPLVAFPHSSVAVQVRVITLVFPQPGTTFVSASVIVTPPHVSEPVATPLEALDSSLVHSIVTSGGTLKAGAVVSTTVITWSAEVAFPHASVAVQVRVITLVFPHPSTTASDSVIATSPHVSEPVAIPLEALDSSLVHSIVTSAGT
jgi:hypothetical protein